MRTLVLLTAIFQIPASLWGQLRLSEVLYNEPGSRTRLEWVELYNPDEIAIPLSNYCLVANGDTINFIEGQRIAGGAYLVICRQLLSEDGSDSFEGHWGDSSGYWGDYVLENYTVIDCDFSLPNSAGAITLIDNNGIYRDSFEWNSAGLDGTSFERDNLHPQSNIWNQCSSTEGSTPGHANSILISTEVFSICVEPRIISIGAGGMFSINITASVGTSVNIEIFNDKAIRKRNFNGYFAGNSPSFIWDGTRDNGDLLEPGIYIILYSIDGDYDKTKSIPVVIAP